MVRKSVKNFFNAPKSSTTFTRPEGAGNFDNMDDFNIVKSISINEGTIQNTPTLDKHVVNKKYVDDQFPVTHASTTGQTTDDHHAQVHTIVSHDTDATGAQLTTLTDDSMADALHRHSELSASDGTPDACLSIDADGDVTSTKADTNTFTIEDSSANGIASVCIKNDTVDWFLRTRSDDTFSLVNDNTTVPIIVKNTAPTNSLVIDDAGKIGIGTASPDSNLHLDGGSTILTIKGFQARINFIDKSTSAHDFQQYIDSNKMHFYADTTGDGTFNQQVLTLESGGDVGIGTASPDTILDVSDATTGYETYVTIQNTNTPGAGATGIVLKDATNELNIRQYGTAAPGFLGNTSGIYAENDLWLNGGDDVIITGGGDFTNYDLVVKSSGKVGIGTSNPSCSLDVNGAIASGTVFLNTAGPTDNVDVSNVNILWLTTTSNNVTVGGLSGGVDGQQLSIVKFATANIAKLENAEGGGSQDIFLTSAADESITAGVRGGWNLVCNGGSWWAI